MRREVEIDEKRGAAISAETGALAEFFGSHADGGVKSVYIVLELSAFSINRERSGVNVLELVLALEQI